MLLREGFLQDTLLVQQLTEMARLIRTIGRFQGGGNKVSFMSVMECSDRELEFISELHSLVSKLRNRSHKWGLTRAISSKSTVS